MDDGKGIKLFKWVGALMYHFATYLDKNYLPRLSLLLESLEEHIGEFKIYVLCLDDATKRHFDHISDTKIVTQTITDLEKSDPTLRSAKANRSLIEYYFTLTPYWCQSILQNHADIDYLCYLDADLYFYSAINSIFEEMAEHSVFIIPHNFSEKNQSLNKYGRFNVGFIAWRNDQYGLACLQKWKDQCLDWCYDRLEDGKFADQKYLDEWPTADYKTKVTDNIGLNLAYYNAGRFKFTSSHHKLLVDDQPVIFYHFHKIKKDSKHTYSIQLLDEAGYDDKVLIHDIYIPYLRKLEEKSSKFGNSEGSIRYRQQYSLKRLISTLVFSHTIIIHPLYSGIVHLEPKLRIFIAFYRVLKRMIKV